MLKNICATRMSLMCLRPPSDQRPRPIHLGHQHYVSILRRRKKGYIVIMEESDENEEYFEVIPMKQCHQRSRSLPFNQFRQIPEVEKPRKSSAHVTLNRVSTKSNNSFRAYNFWRVPETKLFIRPKRWNTSWRRKKGLDEDLRISTKWLD